MPTPTLNPDQIKALQDGLTQLDDVDAQIAAAEKAGLDVSTRKALAAQQRDQIIKLLTVYSPQSLPKPKKG